MKNSAPTHGKYFLRSLHQEIDLYDRKLAYMAKYEVFATPADRELAEKKLVVKRAALEKEARQLAAAGIEFSPADLPRSFRSATEAAEHA